MTNTGGQSWCVVGGGFLGMTLAHRLAQQGHRVTLLEAAPTLGGLASAWQLGDVTWDRHYHVTLLSDSILRALLAELDLDRTIEWKVTKTGFYADRQLYPLNNAVDYLRFPPLGLVGKMRLAATILYGSRLTDGRPLERIPVEDWLTRLSGRKTFERIWRPLLRSKLGENYKRASAAFIWAVIRRVYAARRSGLKTEMFGYVPGGYARIIERFAERLRGEGVRVETACPVERVERVDGKIRVTSAQGVELFDQVAVTLAAPLAARICPGISDDEKRRLGDIVYQGIVCASLLLKRPLPDYYLTYITDEAIPFTAVVGMSTLVDRRELGGNSLVYLPKYVTADDPFFETPDREVEERFLAGLAAMYPDFRRDDVLAFRISRVRQVLAVATLNYSERLPPMTTSVAGLHIVNSAHIVNGTLNVNETIALAETAARSLASTAAPSASAAALCREQAA